MQRLFFNVYGSSIKVGEKGECKAEKGNGKVGEAASGVTFPS